MTSRSGRSALLLLTAATAALSIGGSVGCDAAGATPSPAEIVGRDDGLLFGALGRIEGAEETIAVGSAMAGVLDAVLVDVGDHVAAYQPLARLECSDLASEVAADRESVAVAQAERALVLRGGREDEIRAARSRVAEARAGLAQARRDLGRTLALRKADEAVSEAAEERARTRVRIGEARLRRLEEELRLTIHEPLEEDVALADARVRRARAELDAAEAALARCTIRAPSAGTILQMDARPGEQVAIVGQRPLFRIADLGRWRIRAEIDERYAMRIRRGQLALVSLDEGSSFTACGRVERADGIMGRRYIRSTDPAEKRDRDVLEVIVDDLPDDLTAPVGYRVTLLFAEPGSGAPEVAEAECTTEVADATRAHSAALSSQARSGKAAGQDGRWASDHESGRSIDRSRSGRIAR